MTAIWSHLVEIALTVVVQCTLLTGLAILAAQLVRRNAAFRATTLRLAVIGALMCPVIAIVQRQVDAKWLEIELPHSASGLVPLKNKPLTFNRSHDTYSEWRFIEVHALTTDADSNPITVPTRKLHSQSATPSRSIPNPKPEPVQQALDWVRTSLSVGIAIWVFGFLVGCFGITRSWWKLRQIVRDSRPVSSKSVQSVLRDVQATLAMKTPLRIVSSKSLSSPAAAGICRPVIMLPDDLCRQLHSSELRAILLHEAAHIVRSDNVTLLLERVFIAAFWFHPFAHMLLKRLARAREEVCDNYVLQRVDAPDYGETLLRVMKLTSSTSNFANAAGLFSSPWNLEERISDLLNERRNTVVTTRKFASCLVVITMVFAVIAVGSTTVTAQTAEDEQKSSNIVAGKAADSAAKSSGQNVLAKIKRLRESVAALNERIATLENSIAKPDQRSDFAWDALGIRLTPCDPTIIESLNATTGSHYRGAVSVMEVRPESPAATAGIKAGDILLGIARWQTTDLDDVRRVGARLEQLAATGKTKYYFVRNGVTRFGYLDVPRP